MQKRYSRIWFVCIVAIILIGASLSSIYTNDQEIDFDECSLFEQDYCEEEKVIVITLDDQAHLHSWWNNKHIFSQYDIPVTFYIDRTSKLNETEWSWLESFYADGHEIGVHGSNHTSVLYHIEEGYTIESYIETEVSPEILRFNERGIFPTSFSYPHGHRNSDSDNLLLRHFDIIRATEKGGSSQDLSEIGKFDQRVVNAYSTDREYSPVPGLIERMENSETIITYGHRLDNEDNPYHTTNVDDLITIITEALNRSYKFKTISEISHPDHPQGLENMYDFLNRGSIEIADRMLDNCWTLPRFDEVCFEEDYPSWTENPYDENYWIFVFYSLRPLRHLIYAWEETGNNAYKNHLLGLVNSFSDVADESSYIYDTVADKHGAAFRMMVLVKLKWTLLHDFALSPDETRMIDNLIENTVAYLEKEKNFESQSNHGFNQAAALWVVVSNEKNLENRGERYELAVERLEYMMESVVGNDGVMIENSPYYHLYILNKVGEIWKWAEENNVKMPAIVEKRIPLMMDYAVRATYPDGTVPLIGASIPGYNMMSNDWIKYEDQYQELAWVRSSGERGIEPEFLESYYSSAGQLTWRSSWNNSAGNVSHLLFDAGPYRTHHSDLDALSLTWWSGRSILIDSGLYSYEDSYIRDYFHGTSAHNTLLIDGLDQQEGTTLGIITPTLGQNLGYHLSFAAHELNNVWIGRIIFAIGNHTIVVVDQSISNEFHDYELNWHFASDVELDENNFTLISENETIGYVEFIGFDEVEHKLWKGSEKPFRGWTIEGYENLIQTCNWEIESSEEQNQFLSVSMFSTNESRPIINIINEDFNNLEIEVDVQGELWVIEAKNTALFDFETETDVSIDVHLENS